LSNSDIVGRGSSQRRYPTSTEVASERAARGNPAKAAAAVVTNKTRLPNHSCGISFGRSIAVRMKQRGWVFKQPGVCESAE
jgi:hypothetical protein